MTPRLTIAPSTSDIAAKIADDSVTVLLSLQHSQPRRDVVLTGGTMGIRMLEEIAAHPRVSEIDWSAVHFWWGDERWVPSDSPDRNELQARHALLDIIDVPSENIHAMPSSDMGLTPAEAANAYSDELAAQAEPDAATPAFDLLFLGVGPDGHVASLFPGRQQLFETNASVVPIADSPKPPPERISLTLPAINAAQRAWFVAAGSEKAIAVHLALRGFWFVDLPASGVHGAIETKWYVDQTAAADIDDMLLESLTE